MLYFSDRLPTRLLAPGLCVDTNRLGGQKARRHISRMCTGTSSVFDVHELYKPTSFIFEREAIIARTAAIQHALDIYWLFAVPRAFSELMYS